MALDWNKYTEIAQGFQHKARSQDREDLRHDIILRLAEVARRNGHRPFTKAGMCRIASFVVFEYWRSLNKGAIKVCVLDGVARKPDHRNCHLVNKPEACSDCGFLAVRPVQSLNEEIGDGEGNSQEILDTLADDNAIDLDAWLDARRWLLGCPKTLVTIAVKRDKGLALTQSERKHLSRFRYEAQQSLM